LVAPGDTDAFVKRLTLLSDEKGLRVKMGKTARAEAERWGWESATSDLRNTKYKQALHNFRNRVFGESEGKAKSVFVRFDA